MAVTLKEIKDAVTTYFATHIVCGVLISALPAGTTQINPGEDFSIQLKVTNAGPREGVKIVLPCFHLKVSDPAKAQLIVPPDTIANSTRSQPYPGGSVLAPGTQVQEMFVYKVGWINGILDIGETKTLNLTGHALFAGATNVVLNLVGNVDLELTSQGSASKFQAVSIVN